MAHRKMDELATRIARATGVEPKKVEEVVQLALEELHRITVIDEKGLTAAMMAARFSFGAEAAFHLIGLFVEDHLLHGRKDDAGILNEVAVRLIPIAHQEGCDRIAPWFSERSAARIS